MSPDPEDEPNVDPDDLPDDGGVEIEKGFGDGENEDESDGDNE